MSHFYCPALAYLPVPDFNFAPKIVRCVCDFESCPASDSARLLPAGSTSSAVSRDSLAYVPQPSAGKTPAVAFQAPIICWASRPCIGEVAMRGSAWFRIGVPGVPREFPSGVPSGFRVGFRGFRGGSARDFVGFRGGSAGFRGVPRQK